VNAWPVRVCVRQCCATACGFVFGGGYSEVIVCRMAVVRAER
jgi:hypothetical protein